LPGKNAKKLGCCQCVRPGHDDTVEVGEHAFERFATPRAVAPATPGGRRRARLPTRLVAIPRSRRSLRSSRSARGRGGGTPRASWCEI
jgi:hypothetical protein